IITKEITDFVDNKNIEFEGYSQNYKYVSEDYCFYMYTQSYDGYSVDNSYMYFFVDSQGIYKIEIQRIASLTEIMGKVRTISAIEALTRLLTYDEIKDKEITNIEMTYYTEEAENWQNITRINSDPTWKIKFSDGSQKHLASVD
ncbi:MAG: two-component system regulatory protein YycI, partial [Sedimentibacter sp.]